MEIIINLENEEEDKLFASDGGFEWCPDRDNKIAKFKIKYGELPVAVRLRTAEQIGRTIENGIEKQWFERFFQENNEKLVDEISAKLRNIAGQIKNKIRCECNCKTEKKYISFDEAIRSLHSYKKVARDAWKDGQIAYLMKNDNGFFEAIWHDNTRFPFCIFYKEDYGDDWYIVE